MQQYLLCAAARVRKAWPQAQALARQLAPPWSRPRTDGEHFALGLQGGGALGAFTWGVLDRLIELPGFRPDAVSGASAGAANAVVLAAGWMDGGPDGAKAALENFWRRVGHMPSLFRPSPAGQWFGGTRGSELTALTFEFATAVLSPYEFNPLDHNPLRAVLDELIDFERLRAADAPRLFISATDVETGSARIFDNADVSRDAVLASTCLPQLFHAVEIDGHHYWDGGFTANPPLAPLRRFMPKARPLLVLVNPTQFHGVPRNSRDIAGRLNQILGNAALRHDLADWPEGATIELNGGGHDVADTAKYNNDWRFIRELRDLGRRAAEDWLAPVAA